MTSLDSRPAVDAPRPLQTVLIGTSLEEESDRIVSTGLALARAAGARVFLAHAAPFEPLFDFELGFSPQMQEQTSACEAALSRQIERLGIQPAELAGTAVRIGAPHRILTGLSRSENAGLVVIGATRNGPLAAKLLGSTADRVLRKAACPALVVRGDLPVPPRRVLAPVDLSPLSAEAFRTGLHLLSQLAAGVDAEVRVVYALSILEVLAHRPQESPEIPYAEEQQRCAAELQRFVEENHRGAFRMETAVLPGEARFEILEELERHPADLALLGTQGRGGFERLMLGSVAATVAAKAPCSVLLVPPAAAGEPEPASPAG